MPHLNVPQADESLVEIDAGGIKEAKIEPEEEVKAPFTWPGQKPAEPEPEVVAEAEGPEEIEEEIAEEIAAEEEVEVEAETETDAETEAAVEEEERELRHPRHLKPNQSELDNSDFSLLIVKGGTSGGVEPADVIELVTSKSDLTGSDVRRVRVLSKFTLLQVPTDKAADVAGAIDGASLRGSSVAADAVLPKVGNN